MRLLSVLLLIPTLALSTPAVAGESSLQATLYKNPQCGCCEGYADYLRENGFEVMVKPSVADPHFALSINDVPSLVEELRSKGFDVLENKPSRAPFQEAFVKAPDGNMIEFIGPATAS